MFTIVNSFMGSTTEYSGDSFDSYDEDSEDSFDEMMPEFMQLDNCKKQVFTAKVYFWR